MTSIRTPHGDVGAELAHKVHPPRRGVPKRKGVSRGSTNEHGPIQPLAFLYAWRDLPDVIGRSHAREVPTKEQVDSVVEQRRAELEALVDLAGARA